MVDIVSASKRSQMMAGIKSRNTKPEMVLRSALHRRGYRYRIHRRDLPGTPDLFLPKFQVAVFVQGCFWHGHNCRFFRLPATNTDFWLRKIAANKARDLRNFSALVTAGIKPIEFWECYTRSGAAIFAERLQEIEESILSQA